MDLKEYLKIIQAHLRIFLFVIFLCLVAGLTYFYTQPVSYESSLALNITRSASQMTTEYKYDYFYRLSADEKFADTIVEWLKDPATVSQIYAASKIDSKNVSLKKMSKFFRPEKRSSQVVLVYYSTANETDAKNIATAIERELGKNIENLNISQKEAAWFKIVSEDPVILRSKITIEIALIFALAVGIFLAFWIVLLIHYFKKADK